MDGINYEATEMNRALANRLARLLAGCFSVYANDEWIGSMHFIARRSIIDEAAPAWAQVTERRHPIDLPVASVENLAAQLGDKTLTRSREYEYFGPLSLRCRVYRSSNGESRALVAADIDSVLSVLRAETLYTARIAPLIDSPLADAPRIEDARIILAPCISKPRS